METKPHILTTTRVVHHLSPDILDDDDDYEVEYALRCPEGCTFFLWEECRQCEDADGPTEDEQGDGYAHGVEHASTYYVSWAAKTSRCFATTYEELHAVASDAAGDHPELREPGEHPVSVDSLEDYLSITPWGES